MLHILMALPRLDSTLDGSTLEHAQLDATGLTLRLALPQWCGRPAAMPAEVELQFAEVADGPAILAALGHWPRGAELRSIRQAAGVPGGDVRVELLRVDEPAPLAIRARTVRLRVPGEADPV